MKIEFDIEIPEGWEFARFGKVVSGEKYWNGGYWEIWNSQIASCGRYLVIKKADPPWQPSEELKAALNGYLVRDSDGSVWIHEGEPEPEFDGWYSSGEVFTVAEDGASCIKKHLLPPETIPWNKCRFYLGSD